MASFGTVMLIGRLYGSWQFFWLLFIESDFVMQHFIGEEMKE